MRDHNVVQNFVISKKEEAVHFSYSLFLKMLFFSGFYLFGVKNHLKKDEKYSINPVDVTRA